MLKKKQIPAAVVMLCTILLLVVLTLQARLKLTYIESTTFTQNAYNVIQVAESGEEVVQEFVMPYELLHAVSARIGTNGRDNNSWWYVSVVDPENGTEVTGSRITASQMEDNAYNTILKPKKHTVVTPGKTYELHIRAEDVNAYTAIAFYFAPEEDQETESFGQLAIQVEGGSADAWWQRFYVLIGILILLTELRVLVQLGKEENTLLSCLQSDRALQTLLVILGAFFLLSTFSGISEFTDEYDNMRGGMIIAKGGVLYRDYITQHTPVVYYICALFALTGAASIAQFRILWYLMLALIWGGVYHRHADRFGGKLMALLSAATCILIPTIVTPQGYQIVADNLQGICYVVLLLEFLAYCGDMQIGLLRSIIVSACIWGSFGSAFVSAYALVFVAIFLVIREAGYWKRAGASVKRVMGRYIKLVLAAVIPPLIGFVYFAANDAVRMAFDQFYTFNREIYPSYTDYGSSFVQPFISAVQELFGMFNSNLNSLLKADLSSVVLIRLMLMLGACVALAYGFARKQYFYTLLLLTMLLFSTTRDQAFHRLPTWHVVILIIVLALPRWKQICPRISYTWVCIMLLFMCSRYLDAVSTNLLTEQEAVSELESEVVRLTEDGEEIYIDAYSFDTLYFLYKDRYPANRAVYMLPWYMDRYENLAVGDLLAKMPQVVVYNEAKVSWKQQYYANYFLEMLRQNYTRQSDDEDDWRFRLWVKNDPLLTTTESSM